MLMYIRDRATGWIAWAIVILICIPFALWGVNEYLGPSQNVAVAEVNGEEIHYTEFQQAYSQMRNRIVQTLGPQAVSSGLLSEERLREQAMRDLVNSRVMLQAARDSGMRIADEQLAFAIDSEEAFKDGDQFSQARYEAFLRAQGYSPQGFEFELRRSMLMDQLRAALANAGAIVDTGEVNRMVALGDQRRRFRSATVSAAELAPDAVDDGTLEAYYEQHKDRYVSPEQVTLQYVDVLKSDIEKDVPLDEAELLQRYESQKASFVATEQREASHILLTVDADADENAVEAVRKVATDVKARLDAGEDFEELAKTVSEDPGSASLGGSLGWFGRGVMDARFDEAAFALREGELSEPVRSDFGFHIIKVTGVRDQDVKPFEEVRDTIVAEYRAEQSQQEFFDQAERMANAAFENPGSLDPVAASIDADAKESAPLTRDAATNPEGIGKNQQVLEAAFSTEVLTEGNNSDLIEIGDDQVIVLRVLSHEPTRDLGFEEAKAQVLDDWKLDQARAAAKAKGEELLQGLEGGRSMEEIATEAGLEWSDHQLVDRAGALRAGAAPLFAMVRPPSEGDVRFHGFEAENGDYRILALDRVVDGGESNLTDEQREGLMATLAVTIGQAEFDAVRRGLRDAAEVTEFDQVDN